MIYITNKANKLFLIDFDLNIETTSEKEMRCTILKIEIICFLKKLFFKM